jgi:NADH:ubiquinone oxidoreductase subunit 3 (subunit A)
MTKTLNVESLDRGKTYFWTVIPEDEYSSGSCIDEAFSFYLNSPPQTTLLSPKNGSIVSHHETILKCSSVDAELDILEYHFFVSDEKTDVLDLHASSLNITTEPTFTLKTLMPGLQYYWTVICSDEYELGRSINGIFTFRVNNPPEIIPVEDQEVEAGLQFTLDINGSDSDEDDLEFSLLSGPNGLVIVSTTGVITWTPSSDEIGQNQVKVRVFDGLDSSNFTFFIDVKKSEEVNEEKDEDNENSILSVVIIIVVVIVILILIVLVILLLLRRKRHLDEENEESPKEFEISQDISNYTIGENESPENKEIFEGPNSSVENQAGDLGAAVKYESIGIETVPREELFSNGVTEEMDSGLKEEEQISNPIMNGNVQDSGSRVSPPPSGEGGEEMDEITNQKNDQI